VIVAFLLLLSGTAQAAVPVGSDFRISNMGADGDASRGAFNSTVAYNSKDNEYLVVWSGDGGATDDEDEIYGQRIDAATGAQIGGDFPISAFGTQGDVSHGAVDPVVAYDAADNQYLVAWYAGDLVNNNDFEIYGQRLSASGAEIGANDFPISTTGPNGDPTRKAYAPAIAYDSTASEYLVVWVADKLTAGEFEIFGQRITAATGAETGPDDFRISNVGNDGDTQRAAEAPSAAYDSQNDQYLVVWDGDQLANDKFEVYGQLVSSAGAEVGSDFQISTTFNNQPNNTARKAFSPTVAYGSQPNEYLVAWEGNPLTQIGEYEIFGQRVSATGTKVGTNNLRISTVGVDQDMNRIGENPAASYNPVANEYVVVFDGDGLSTNNEFEIFGQRLSAAGADIGGDFRISHAGTDGDSSRIAYMPTVASSTKDDVDLVTWYGDELATDNENEIFGHWLGAPLAAPTNLAVTQSAGIVKASWALPASPPGVQTGVLEFSPSLSTDASGFFTDRSSISYHYYNNATTFDSTPVHFPAGTYYVHVATYDPSCDPATATCFAFTSPAKLVVPDTGTSGTELRLTVSAKRFQRALKSKALTLRVTCNVNCTVTATTHMSIPRASRIYSLRSVTTTLSASKTTTVRVKLSRALIRTVKRALKRHKRVTATVNVTARDSAKTLRRVRRSIRIRK
jgi:hypothetical protein